MIKTQITKLLGLLDRAGTEQEAKRGSPCSTGDQEAPAGDTAAGPGLISDSAMIVNS
jgi:hypothetical protein